MIDDSDGNGKTLADITSSELEPETGSAYEQVYEGIKKDYENLLDMSASEILEGGIDAFKLVAGVQMYTGCLGVQVVEDFLQKTIDRDRTLDDYSLGEYLEEKIDTGVINE